MLTPTKPVKSCECGSPCGDCCGCTKESIGLGNVDNTSDLNKPLSTAMINALSGKVDLDTFTQLKNRVLALENSIPDITALEHRMDEAEDDILGLNAGYTALHNTVLSMADSITELGGRVTGVTDALVTVNTRVDALEVADGNNVKLRGVSEQTIEGKLKANDPSSGATDNTLVTANWVSQTGDSAPNNIVHRSGNETINGTKAFTNVISGRFGYDKYIPSSGGIGKWVKIASFPSNMLHFFLTVESRFDYTIVTGSLTDMLTKTHSANAGDRNIFKMIVETDGTFTLWYQLRIGYNTYYFRNICAERYASELTVTIPTDSNWYDEPTPGQSYYDSQEMA